MFENVHEVLIYQQVTCKNFHLVMFVVLYVGDMEPTSPHRFMLYLHVFLFSVYCSKGIM